MTAIATLTPQPEITIRHPRPGDIGWLIHRQGAIYFEEYGWDWRFEGLAAEIYGQYVANFNPAKERCWIAERNGEILGSILLAYDTDEHAKLRMLYVEQAARGTGLGKRLVKTCLDFAREVGYRRVTLWTNARLHAAHKLYQDAGFKVISEEPYENFGQTHTVQIWETILK